MFDRNGLVFFADEATPETTEIQDQLIDGSALVPSVWFLEVTNVLLMAEKRNRISITDATEFLRLLGALDQCH